MSNTQTPVPTPEEVRASLKKGLGDLFEQILKDIDSGMWDGATAQIEVLRDHCRTAKDEHGQDTWRCCAIAVKFHLQRLVGPAPGTGPDDQNDEEGDPVIIRGIEPKVDYTQPDGFAR